MNKFSLIVLAIVLGLLTVGVVLMSTMLTVPTTAARQWTDRLASMAQKVEFAEMTPQMRSSHQNIARASRYLERGLFFFLVNRSVSVHKVDVF